ncbi:MAG: HAMP domain-containing sensor histidine kinase [Rectinemataceae bacterium]|jgi:signal transduction histidine kinase
MKIRTQSYILIVGIAIMPIVVLSLFFVYERTSHSAIDIGGGGHRSLSSEDLVRLLQKAPKGFDLAVADPWGSVIYSTIPSIPLGSAVALSIATAAHDLPVGQALIFGIGPPLPKGFTIVTSVPIRTLIVHEPLIIGGVLALAVIIVFASVMCILIVSSLTRSVVSLEAATRRVAAGELDLPISIEGSNEITSLSRSLNSLREEIKEDQARRARFIMGISHDLKTPLALVKGYTEALEEDIGDAGPKASSYLGIIKSKANQLEGMIEDLIDFERVDTGEWSQDLASVDLAPFLRVFSRRIEADAALLGRRVHSAITLPEPSFVRMDERLVTRALENLVNNALRYTSSGGRIDITARAEGESYIVSVIDNGPGIFPQDLPHIFELFYRGSSSRREPGMGLGLSIVKTVVESHGWTIDVLPGRDHGAAFVLTIPISAT